MASESVNRLLAARAKRGLPSMNTSKKEDEEELRERIREESRVTGSSSTKTETKAENKTETKMSSSAEKLMAARAKRGMTAFGAEKNSQYSSQETTDSYTKKYRDEKYNKKTAGELLSRVESANTAITSRWASEDAYKAELKSAADSVSNYETQLKMLRDAFDETQSADIADRYNTMYHDYSSSISAYNSLIDEYKSYADAYNTAFDEYKAYIDETTNRDPSLYDLFVNSAKRGYYNSQLGVELSKQISGQSNNAEKYREILDDGDYMFKTDDWWEKLISGASEQIGQWAESWTDAEPYQYGASGALAGASAAALAGQMGPQIALPEEIATVPAGAVTGFTAGFATGSAMHMSKVESGHAYNELKELGIRDEIAIPIAQGVGGVNGLIEALQTDELLDAFHLVEKKGSDSLLKWFVKELARRGIDVGIETLQEVGQEFVTIGGVQLASKIDTGEWAYTLPEVGERVGETAASSALSFAGMNIPSAVVNTGRTVYGNKKATDIGSKIAPMGQDTVQAIIEEGLATKQDTESYQLAKTMQEKIAKGETVSEREVGALYQANLKNVDPRQAAPSTETVDDVDNANPSETAEETLMRMARETVAEQTNVAQAMTQETGAEVSQDTVLAQQRRASMQEQLSQIRESKKRAVDSYGYGESGTRAFNDVLEKTGVTPEEARTVFQTPYEAGLRNTPRDALTFDNGVQEAAYNAGREDYIVNMHKTPNAATGGTKSGFHSVNAPKDVSKTHIKIIDNLARELGSTVEWDDGDYNGRILEDGSVRLSRSFNRTFGGESVTAVFHAAHEIGMHRLMQLAPKEGQAFINAMYGYLSEGRPSSLPTLAEAKTDYYGSRGVKLTTPKAMEEVVANSILDLYDGDIEKFHEAVRRVAQGNDVQAKKGLAKFREILAEIAEKLRRMVGTLTGKERAEAKQALSEIEQLRNMYEEALGAAIKQNRENVAKRDGKVFRTTSENGMETVETSVGNPVMQTYENGTAQLSLKTYDAFGRAELKRWLDQRVSKGLLVKADAAEIIRQLDEYYDICQTFKNKYAPFGAWSDASVVTDNNGKPVFSVVKANGEYAMNLDFSLVCKKRRTLDAVFGEMIRRGMMDNVDLGQEDISKINDIIRESGFETACALCFVDAKRYRQAQVADAFVNQYNELVRMLLPGGDVKAHHFDFVGTGNYKDGGVGLHTIPDAQLGDGIAKLKQVMRENSKLTVAHKIAKHLLANPQDRRLVVRGEFMNTDGFDAVRVKNARVLSLYNSSKGSGGPKAAFSDVQYLGEILKKTNFTPERAYAVGGVRIQSFSDYVPRLVFDYMQMIGDLAAKKLPAHAYTKEAMFAMQFGMTGIKVNMSLVPAVAKNGVAPGLDANGDYLWFDGQSFGSDVNVKGSGKTGYELAVKIQNAAGYSANCGTIAVGVSDAHIRKMLDDPNIRMVIPYHKSSLNHIIAVMNNIDQYKDYTGVQNTRSKATGSKISGKDFNFNAALRKHGDAKAAANEYLAWCEKNGYIPKFDDFAKHENYYKLLEDFSTYDGDAAAPQGAVTMTFPKEGAPFGSMAELIEQGLEEDAILEGKRDKQIPEIVDKVGEVLKAREQYSLKEEEGAQYSLVEDEETLEFLNQQEWVKVYRAMYQDETGLYPPMGAIQGGKRVDPVEFRTWYQADEHPELIKFEVPVRYLKGELNSKGKPRKSSRFLTEEEVEANREVLYDSHKPNDVIRLASGNTIPYKDLKSKFELVKADGGTDVPAAYNPYFHTSLSALNDQFSTAYKRPGLVVVEGYIPKSELTSGYQALYAKDPVGETTWKSGVVATNLKGDKARKVFLSRWFRAERVVSDAEAAGMIAKVLEGENLRVPWNVVTPALRNALEQSGVDIDYDYVYSGTSFDDFQKSGEQYSLKYDYDTLVAKPDMRLSSVDDTVEYKANSQTRKDIVREAVKNAAKIGKTDEYGGVSVYVDDVDTDVVLSTHGLQHGLDRRLQNNAAVIVNAGEILRNAIRINELTPKKAEVAESYVLLGAAKGKSGTFYVVEFVVNRYDNTVSSIDVLYSVNAKKESAVLNAPAIAGSPLRITDSTISIAQLLEFARESFPDVLPESVLRHFGFDRRPDGALGESSLYSLKDSEGNELSKAQAEFFKDSKVRDEKGNLRVMWHGTASDFTVFDIGRAGRNWGGDSRLGKGFYFADTERDARRWTDGSKVVKAYLNIVNPLDIDAPTPKNIAAEIDKYIEKKIDSYDEIGAFITKEQYISNLQRIKEMYMKDVAMFVDKFKYDENGKMTDGIREFLSGLGYDGIVSKNETVAFYPEQIKRTDNLNPTGDPDIRYSLKEDDKLLRENEKLKEVNAALKEQFKLTKVAKVDKKSLDAFAKSILKDYQSGADIVETRQKLDELFTYIANGEDGQAPVWEDVWKRAYETAAEILESASVLDDEMWQSYKGLRDTLRTTGVSLDKRYESDLGGYENLSEFRKANYGRILIKNDGIPVDSFFQELAYTYPEYFDADETTHPAEQLLRMAEVLDELAPTQSNPFEHNLREAATWLASDIIDRFYELPQAKPTFADKADRKLTEQKIKAGKKLEALREKNKEKIRKLIEESREKLKTVRADERAKRQKAVGEVKEHYKTKEAKASENRKASVLRGQIIRHVQELQQTLLKPNDKHHIPENLRKPVAELLDAINLESQYVYDPETGKRHKDDGTGGDPTRRTIAFDNLRKVYKQIIEEDGSDVVVDPYIELVLERMSELRDVRLADMNRSQLEEVWSILRFVEHSVLNAGKTLSSEKYARTVEWAEAMQEDTETRRRMRGRRGESLRLDLENPYTFFSHYGDAGKAVYRMLRDAQDRQQMMVNAVADAVGKIVDPKTVRKLEKEVHTFKTSRGEKLTLTKAHIMDIYLLSKREQAQDHLLKGGIVQPEVESKHIKRGTDAILLTMDDLMNIVGKMTVKEREIAIRMQKLTATTLADYGNEASLKAYGYKKFTGEDYWTIKSAKEGVHSNIEKGAGNTRSIKNIGLAKAVMPMANNPLDIGGIFKTFASHAADMTDYAAWLCPMEDANRLFNFQFRDEDGNRTGKTIKGLLDAVGGRNAQQYWHRLMEDIQNGIKAQTDNEMVGAINKVIGNARGASVGANIRVIVQQPTAILRAAMVLSPMDMAKGMIGGGGWKTALAYSPIAQRKDMGGFDISSPMQMQEILFDSKTVGQKFNDAMMWGAGKADSITWGRIWSACEASVKRKHKDLKPKSAEFYKAVNDLFTEVIDQSQVVDGVLQRTQAMRSSNALMNQATAFMGEPMMSMNMLLRAYDGIVHEKDGKKRGKAIKNFGRAAVVLAVTNTVNALAQSLIDAIRDDEDDEYWNKFWAAFYGVTGEEETAWEKATAAVLGGNLGSNMNPITYIPFAKDALSLLQGYNVTRADADVMGDIIDSFKTFTDSVFGDGTKTIGKASFDLTKTVLKVFGNSAPNVERDIMGLLRTIAIETDNIAAQYEMEKWIYKVGNEKNTNRFVDIMYKAYETDKYVYEHIYRDLMANGVDAEKVKSRMETKMKKAHGVTKVSELESRYLPPDQQNAYDKQMKTIKSSNLWKSANADQRDELESNLYDLTVGNGNGEDLQAKIDAGSAYGVDETEYLLYRMALDMADTPNKNGKLGGTPTNAEKADAIRMMGDMSNSELAYLWDTEQGYEAYAEGIDMESYINALGEGYSVNLEKLVGAKDQNISEDTYFDFLDMLDRYDKPTESGKLGTFTQDEAKAAISAMPGLSRAQRAWLWQSVNKGWKDKNNPWR